MSWFSLLHSNLFYFQFAKWRPLNQQRLGAYTLLSRIYQHLLTRGGGQGWGGVCGATSDRPRTYSVSPSTLVAPSYTQFCSSVVIVYVCASVRVLPLLPGTQASKHLIYTSPQRFYDSFYILFRNNVSVDESSQSKAYHSHHKYHRFITFFSECSQSLFVCEITTQAISE